MTKSIEILNAYLTTIETDSAKANRTSAVKRFLKFEDSDTLSSITINAVKNYLDTRIEKVKANTYNTEIEYLKHFYEFAHTNYNIVEFQMSDLNEFRVVVKKEETRTAIPLTLQQLIQVRKEMKDKDMVRQLFYFELVYAYELSNTKQIMTFADAKYNENFNVFILKNGEHVKASSELAKLIKTNGMPSSTKNTIEYDMREWNNLIDRDIIIKDIVFTKERNSITCPMCGGKHENKPSNWVKYVSDLDGSEWNVCAENCGQ